VLLAGSVTSLNVLSNTDTNTDAAIQQHAPGG
jgi:hypothetical protein